MIDPRQLPTVRADTVGVPGIGSVQELQVVIGEYCSAPVVQP